jgi:cytochrome c oxidase assembly factor CtaG
MGMQSVLLSLLLTFANASWYEGYRSSTAPWGLDALADQQLAGVIMWVPAGLIYLATALGLLVAWLREIERDATTDRSDAGARPDLRNARLTARP